MTIRPIGNEADYDVALAEIDRLMGAGPGTPEGDALEVLVTMMGRKRSSVRSGRLGHACRHDFGMLRSCHG